ncbi:MAG: 1-deoxy-D-xylulose-5-phosphate reductoisomerase [Firmicutes bacterium]|nr:1-deoxy-D-xylulose-5-phosphate reductoisomerase [Bacillota bacterium]
MVVLGSTGSIGRQTLEVARALPDRVAVVGLAAGGGGGPGAPSVRLFAEQVLEWRPEVAALSDVSAAREVERETGVRVLAGPEGVVEAATWPGTDLVLNAVVGFAGLEPTLSALAAGKDVAVANKEPLVAAGRLVVAEARRSGTRIIPVDSEPSAVFQLLDGKPARFLRRIVLTASGGPFYGWPPERLAEVTPSQALAHPTWRMGPKITVDSATLMNKGFEVLEAMSLFGLPADAVDVLVHRHSLVHALVELNDGTVLAHVGPPDMRYPIQHALTYPERVPAPWPRLDLAEAPPLEFDRPDLSLYPCLSLAYHVGRIGQSYPAVLSAADEVLVAAFLSGRLRFTDIPRLLEEIVEGHTPFEVASLEDARRADALGREAARAVLAG